MLVSVERKTLERHKHTVLELHPEIMLSLVFLVYQCDMWVTGLDEWMNTSFFTMHEKYCMQGQKLKVMLI